MAASPPRPNAHSALHAGMTALIACDSGEVVSGIVGFVVSQHRALRLLSRGLARADGSALAAALIVLNGVRCYAGVQPRGRGKSVVAARRPNERRAVAGLQRMLPERRWTDLAFEWRFLPVCAALASLWPSAIRDGRRSLRLARRLNRRYGVFRALRVVELFAYYRRYCELFAQRPFELAVMSSNSNPHGIALNLAARRFDVPIVLVTHGMPVRPLARLDYDLTMVECEASRRVYEEEGCGMGRTVVKSRKAEFAPMRLCRPPDGLRVGVFLSKDPVEERVMSCVRSLLADSQVAEVRVRPHPVNLWPGLAARMASLGDRRISVRSGTSLAADLAQCDLILAGNSTVLLDAVVSGCPAGYVRGFDHGPYDVQSFVRDGLICESTDFEAIARFYKRDGWPAILRHYADVDRDEADVARLMRAAVNDLVNGNAYARGAA
jgi:hypothetical protein